MKNTPIYRGSTLMKNIKIKVNEIETFLNSKKQGDMSNILTLKLKGKWNILLFQMRVKLKFFRAALKALAVIFFTSSKKRFFSKS